MAKKQAFGPQSKAPLTAAIRCGDTIVISGQVPVDGSGAVPAGVEAQTRAVLEKVRALVTEAGGSMADIVKTTVFITDRADFAAMNAVYQEFFPNFPPARSTIECGLMIDIKVEIEAMAIIGAGA